LLRPVNPTRTDATGVFNSTLSRDIALPVNATVDQLDDIPISEVQSFKEPALPWYSDQALPFEITVAMANEYGSAASAKLFGVEILNEGWGMSIDDSVNEMQATFVACISLGWSSIFYLSRSSAGLPGATCGPKHLRPRARTASHPALLNRPREVASADPLEDGCSVSCLKGRASP